MPPKVGMFAQTSKANRVVERSVEMGSKYALAGIRQLGRVAILAVKAVPLSFSAVGHLRGFGHPPNNSSESQG